MISLFLLVRMMIAFSGPTIVPTGPLTLIPPSTKLPSRESEADHQPQWSGYGRLAETKLRCENDLPIYALRDGDKLVTYVATNPGKSLATYVGRTIAVYGSATKIPNEDGPCILATHVAMADEPDPIPAKAGKFEKELKRFQGKWAPQSATFDGVELEKDKIADLLTVFEGTKSTAMRKDKVLAFSSIAIDPTKSPSRFDITYQSGPLKGITVEGIYKFEDDTLIVCLAFLGDRPTEFASTPGSGSRVYVYKKVKADESK